MDLLNADLPSLPGLAVADGELTYQGKKWDGMSGSDQLKVGVAIPYRQSPETLPNCGFVLLDKLEQMDLWTPCRSQWLGRLRGVQAIARRVSTGKMNAQLLSRMVMSREQIISSGRTSKI